MPDLHALANAISDQSPNVKAFAEAVADVLQPVPSPVMGSALDAFLPRLGPSDSGRTIEVAAGASLAAAVKGANPGDTVVVRGGKRTVDLQSAHFTRDHPVTVHVYPGESVMFTGPVHGLYVGDVTGVRFDMSGMVADSCGNDGVKLDNVVDFELLGGVSQHNATNGLLVGGQGSASTPTWVNRLSQRVRIDGLSSRHNGNSSQYHGAYFGGGSANSSTPAGVDHFLFVNMEGYAIPGGFCAQFGGMARNGIMANCTADLFGMPKSSRGGAPGCYVVYNQADQPWPTSNVLFVNSLASYSPTGGFQGSGGKDMSSNVVRSCMGWRNAAGTYLPTWGSTKVFTLGVNYPDADPLYVAPGLDYHLQAGSPARGLGDAAYMPPLDRDGVARTVATLGAYA